jgi:hypothetical protein
MSESIEHSPFYYRDSTDTHQETQIKYSLQIDDIDVEYSIYEIDIDLGWPILRIRDSTLLDGKI